MNSGGTYKRDLREIQRKIVEGITMSGGPSCNDGIQNQGETGVDCGGPCSPCTGADANGDGCVDINEIVAYVGKWKNGQVTIQEVVAGVEQWKQGCP